MPAPPSLPASGMPSGAFPAPRRRLGRYLAEADLLGELRTLPRVVRRHHRIVGGKAPLRPILLGRHVVGGAKMTLQHLQLLAVFATDDVLGRDRLLDRPRQIGRASCREGVCPYG